MVALLAVEISGIAVAAFCIAKRFGNVFCAFCIAIYFNRNSNGCVFPL